MEEPLAMQLTHLSLLMIQIDLSSLRCFSKSIVALGFLNRPARTVFSFIGDNMLNAPFSAHKACISQNERMNNRVGLSTLTSLRPSTFNFWSTPPLMPRGAWTTVTLTVSACSVLGLEKTVYLIDDVFARQGLRVKTGSRKICLSTHYL